MIDLSNENVVHVKKGGIQYLQFRKLLEYKEIKHAYILGTDMNFRTAKKNKERLPEASYNKAVEDYKKVCNVLEENYINVVKTNQNHTDNIKAVENKVNKDFMDVNLKEYDNTDGLITNKKDFILSTTNADCILLLFYDSVKKVIANVHSGWRGTLQRISVKAVEKMQKEFGCNPQDIIACMCPSIRKCHFEVDEDVKNMFEEEFMDLIDSEKRNAHNFKKTKSCNETITNNSNKEDIEKNCSAEIITKQKDTEKWDIDTILINRIILQKKGLRPENIVDSGICSVCNSDIVHSYRVEGSEYGLATALIELK